MLMAQTIEDFEEAERIDMRDRAIELHERGLDDHAVWERVRGMCPDPPSFDALRRMISRVDDGATKRRRLADRYVVDQMGRQFLSASAAARAWGVKYETVARALRTGRESKVGSFRYLEE